MKKLTICFLGGLLSVLFSIDMMAIGQSKDSLSLDDDIRVVSIQISEAIKEYKEHSGGLAQALIIYRLQILKNTKAMLEQKKYALKHGIPVTYTHKGETYKAIPPDPTIIQSLESEIRHQQEELSKALAETRAHSGGMLKAMSLFQIATIKNTIAILDQRKLTEEHGIPLFVPSYEALEDEEVPTVATVSEPQPATWTVIAKKANVRGGPGADYTKLFELSRFDEFEVIDLEGNWLKIITKEKREGWLHRNLAKPK
ncbi:MAG: SH3 domain-containing protein [Proteobacteria bacterium]|nr:SH3 domain-containing protein [Pseudomonadota bacterium]